MSEMDLRQMYHPVLRHYHDANPDLPRELPAAIAADWLAERSRIFESMQIDIARPRLYYEYWSEEGEARGLCPWLWMCLTVVKTTTRFIYVDVPYSPGVRARIDREQLASEGQLWSNRIRQIVCTEEYMMRRIAEWNLSLQGAT
jgi:hypothetical protein